MCLFFTQNRQIIFSVLGIGEFDCKLLCIDNLIFLNGFFIKIFNYYNSKLHLTFHDLMYIVD